ncbi:MAG: trigger factor family protein [Candidatus Cardinium sp.]|uniref:trigger factor n=1 Tax=Cardinium endosymbiont of Dermatophagoides farinae TaxID=2597823 RepID=UPI001642F113|nr:trigger factor [Cardinium endosymbiont of Dermatophagoides farinae]UWW97132.1 MAG: trigger factor family protein [Candidatus Cardinium sp.]
MNIQFNKLDPSHGIISITLDEPDYKPSVDKQLKHYAQNARLKGFRFGAVPADLIKKMHGPSILAEELHKIAAASLKNYIIQERIAIFMEPLLVPSSEEIDLKNQRSFTFSYEVGLIEERAIVLDPTISITEFQIDSVGSKLVDEFLEGLQIVHGEAVHLEESTTDAILYGTLTDSTGAVGLDIRIVIMRIPEHSRQTLVGLRIGNKVTITEELLKDHFSALLGVSFGAFASFKRHKSAWPAVFTIDKILRVVPAPLEPKFFDLVLGKGIAATESDFREAIAKIILLDKRMEARHAFYEDLQTALCKHNAVDLPEAFLKKWLSMNNPKATLEEIEGYYRANEESLKWELLLTTIIRQNNLSVNASDVVEETKRAYIDYAHNNNLEIEGGDAAIHASAVSFLKGSNKGSQYYAKVYHELTRDRAINFIKEQMAVVTETVTAEAFDARR